MFYHTKDRGAASDFADGGRVVEGFSVLVGARVDEDVVARADVLQVAALVEDGEPADGVGRGDGGFPMDEEAGGEGEVGLLGGFFVAGEPVVGLVDAEGATRPADEGVVVGVLVGMEARRAEQSWQADEENCSCA